MDIFTCYLPVYYLSKIFGQANYKITNHPENTTVKQCVKTKIYSLIFLTFLTITSQQTLYTISFREDYYERFVFAFFLYFNFILATQSVVTNLVYNQQIISCLQRLISLDKRLKNFGIHIDYSRDKRTTITLLIFQYILIGIYYKNLSKNMKFSGNDHLDVFIFICLIIRKNIRVLIFIQFEVLMILLKRRYDLLFNNLLGLSKSCVDLKYVVNETAEIHLEMNSITRSLNDFYSGLLLVLTVISENSIIFDSYKLVVLSFDWITLYSLTSHALFFMICVHYCGETIKSANRIKTILHEINVCQEDIRREVFGFSLQLFHDELSLTAGGCFPLDYTLFFTVAATTLSYLVILLQFHQTS